VAEKRSILLVAYFYPPCPDTGTHRAAAMAKYLRRLGHRVTVLTTSAYGSLPGEEGVVRTRDLQLVRARLGGHDRVQGMFEADSYSGRPHPLGKLLVPEPLIAAWAPFARPAAQRLAQRERFDCVITTSPPESAHWIGRALRRRGIPWVADIRDAWNFEPLRPPFATGLQRRLDERLERRWLGDADVVTVVSQPAGDDLRDRLGLDPVLVANAWDPDLEAGLDGGGDAAPSQLDADRTSLVYTGRFGSYGRDPAGLVAGIRELAREDPSSAERLELVIAGPVTDDERRLLESDLSPARIVLLGSLPRERAVALQRSADALLLLADSRRSQLANLKLFEYLAAGRPILALAEGTEAGRIVRETGAGDVVASNDPAAIRDAMRRLVAGELSAPDPGAVRRYTYPAAAERMAEAVEAAIRRTRTSSGRGRY
jgi:glycosyltransferase involved in cell wall biosynthesis